jgi:zinc D-Ala-D-Ala carboxypeptidase
MGRDMWPWAAVAVGVLVYAGKVNRDRVIEDMGSVRLSENFTLGEMVKTATGFDNVPSASQVESLKALCVNILQPLRNRLNRPLIISSGFRGDAVNKAVNGADHSQHSKGEAADFHVDGMTNSEIIAVIRTLRLPYDQLIDEQLNGKAWIHVSYCRLRASRLQWMTARDNRPNKYETVQAGKIA